MRVASFGYGPKMQSTVICPELLSDSNCNCVSVSLRPSHLSTVCYASY